MPERFSPKNRIAPLSISVGGGGVGGGFYLEGCFNGGFFALPVWGAYIWRGSRGLFSQFYGIIGRK